MSDCKCKGPDTGGKLISKCPPCDSPCDVIDCNDIPFERDCHDRVIMPFRDIVKPGDKDADSYPFKRDDMCRAVVCGCPKTQHDEYYPTKGGDPCIGVEYDDGTEPEFDPDTGKWTLKKPRYIEIVGDPNCNILDIEFDEETDIYTIGVKPIRWIRVEGPFIDSTPSTGTVASGGEVEVADTGIYCWTNTECSAVALDFVVDCGMQVLDIESGDLIYGTMKFTKDGGATYLEKTQTFVVPDDPGGASTVAFVQVYRELVEPGTEVCFGAKLVVGSQNGSATPQSHSLNINGDGYTVHGFSSYVATPQ